MPMTQKIRQMALQKHLGEEAQDFDLKANVKEILGRVFTKAFGKPLKAKDSLTIFLEFSNHPDEEEFFALFKSDIQSVFGQQKKKKIKKHQEKDNKQTNCLTSQSVGFLLTNLAEKVGEISKSTLQKNLKEGVISLKLESPNIFLAGNYLKYSRFLSQTPWEIDGKKLYETSIEEIIVGPILKEFQPSSHKFHSGGREDIDVRMLGNGRPFVVELINSKKRTFTEQFIRELEHQVNNQ